LVAKNRGKGGARIVMANCMNCREENKNGEYHFWANDGKCLVYSTDKPVSQLRLIRVNGTSNLPIAVGRTL